MPQHVLQHETTSIVRCNCVSRFSLSLRGTVQNARKRHPYNTASRTTMAQLECFMSKLAVQVCSTAPVAPARSSLSHFCFGSTPRRHTSAARKSTKSVKSRAAVQHQQLETGSAQGQGVVVHVPELCSLAQPQGTDSTDKNFRPAHLIFECSGHPIRGGPPCWFHH